MKKLFSCLFAALCAVGLSIPALADPVAVPDSGEADPAKLTILLVAVAAAAIALIIWVLRDHKK